MRFHNITKDDMLNGEGLRVVLWVSGCEHACKGCHNEIAWDINDGLLFDDSAKAEIFEYLGKDYASGITLSGGDPLHAENRAEIGLLIKEIKEKFPQKTIWLYTGYLWQEIKDIDFIQLVDIVVDGKFDSTLTGNKLKWVGSSNQRIIDVKKGKPYEKNCTIL